jgi:putative membrane protein
MALAGALIAYLHYVAMISIAVVLVAEYGICMPGMPGTRIRVLARLDRLYLGLAVLALGSGAARVVWFGRGAAFYLHNPVFYIKLALFLAVGLISIPPTLQILRWMRSLNSGAANVVADYEVLRVRRLILVELALFAFIPLMATLMARGIGMQPAAQ